MNTESWDLLLSAAAMLFNFGYIGQVIKTYRTKDVDCLSLFQWVGFSLASLVFVGFYAHLGLWAMTTVSVLGLLCCLFMLIMIIHFKQKLVSNKSFKGLLQ